MFGCKSKALALLIAVFGWSKNKTRSINGGNTNVL